MIFNYGQVPSGWRRLPSARWAARPHQLVWCGAAFLGMTVLTALGTWASIDRWCRALADTLSFHAVDVLGSVLSYAGNMEVTGLIALLLAVRWGRQYGWRGGLAPLWLFAGVAVEIALKYALCHPPPPPLVFQIRWHLPFGWSLAHALPDSLWLPYAFPSGHVLRTTFLVSLCVEQLGRCYRLAGVALIIVMACTRVYMNEHWLSDVIGGYLLGLTMAAVATAIRRGQAGRATEGAAG